MCLGLVSTTSMPTILGVELKGSWSKLKESSGSQNLSLCLIEARLSYTIYEVDSQWEDSGWQVFTDMRFVFVTTPLIHDGRDYAVGKALETRHYHKSKDPPPQGKSLGGGPYLWGCHVLRASPHVKTQPWFIHDLTNTWVYGKSKCPPNLMGIHSCSHIDYTT